MFIIPHILYLLTADNSTWAISLYHRITINRAEPCSVDGESGEQFFYSSGSKGVFHSPFESLTAIGVITVAPQFLTFLKGNPSKEGGADSASASIPDASYHLYI